MKKIRLKTSKPLILRAFPVCRNYTVRALKRRVADRRPCAGHDGGRAALGHAQVSTTTNIYAGFIRSSDARAADALGEAFSRILKTETG